MQQAKAALELTNCDESTALQLAAVEANREDLPTLLTPTPTLGPHRGVECLPSRVSNLVKAHDRALTHGFQGPRGLAAVALTPTPTLTHSCLTGPQLRARTPAQNKPTWGWAGHLTPGFWSMALCPRCRDASSVHPRTIITMQENVYTPQASSTVYQFNCVAARSTFSNTGLA